MKAISKNPESLKRATQAVADAARASVREARRNAYASEADPFAFKLLRGEATPEEYAAKVAEIRARFPYEKEA